MCQGTVCRLGVGGTGYGLGVPERAGSLAEGHLLGRNWSVCSGSDAHNSVFFRVSSPKGAWPSWGRQYLAGTQLRRRLTFSIAHKATIYMWQQTTWLRDVLLPQQEGSSRVVAGLYPDITPSSRIIAPMIQRVPQYCQKNRKKGEKNITDHNKTF